MLRRLRSCFPENHDREYEPSSLLCYRVSLTLSWECCSSARDVRPQGPTVAITGGAFRQVCGAWDR